MQATLSNGNAPTALFHLANPPGPIVIDSKFPAGGLRGRWPGRHEIQAEIRGPNWRVRGARPYQKPSRTNTSLRGETADGALMFPAFEAVYAELQRQLS